MSKNDVSKEDVFTYDGFKQVIKCANEKEWIEVIKILKKISGFEIDDDDLVWVMPYNCLRLDILDENIYSDDEFSYRVKDYKTIKASDFLKFEEIKLA